MSSTKWLLGGLGFVLAGPLGAVLGVVIASMFDSAKQLPGGEGTASGEPRRTKASTGDIRLSLLVLFASVMKADGHVRRSELDMVKRFLLHSYGEEGAKEALQVLRQVLEQDFDAIAIASQIADHVNYSTRLELLHFLLDLAAADGEFDDSEDRLIARLSNALRLSDADYRALRALYLKDADPDWAYTALEIEPGATNEEVKKAYRRMAMKYHPDKVSGAGEEIQQKATEKFRSINEAYEHIKKQRGL